MHHHVLLSHLSALIPLPPSRSLHPPFQTPHCLRSFSAAARHKAVVRATGLQSSVAELPELAPSPPQGGEDGGGPIELPPSYPSPLFSVDDNPSTLQVATSVLLTGAISVFLFRSLRRRANRAKELRVRSTGLTKKKDIKEEALDSLRAMGVAPVEAGAPPSPVQAMLGAIAAGTIAIILYKFTTTIEASLNRQTIPDNFSVRQITITVRTIVNGICYLATFVFGINSLGLFLYSIQLIVNSLMGNTKEEPQTSVKDSTASPTDTIESRSYDIQDRSDDA